MRCSAYFGELSEERKLNWNNEDSNPYGVLKTSINLYAKGHVLLAHGSIYFHDKIQIDWGSFAWKCTSDEIIKFLIDHKSVLSWVAKEEDNVIKKVKKYIEKQGDTEYGVIFIEED